MDLSSLRNLLAQTYSTEICAQILRETSLLYREDRSDRWYFLLLYLIFFQIIDNSELYDADRSEPLFKVLSRQSLDGIDAIANNNVPLLISSANQLAEAYSGML